MSGSPNHEGALFRGIKRSLAAESLATADASAKQLSLTQVGADVLFGKDQGELDDSGRYLTPTAEIDFCTTKVPDRPKVGWWDHSPDIRSDPSKPSRPSEASDSTNHGQADNALNLIHLPNQHQIARSVIDSTCINHTSALGCNGEDTSGDEKTSQGRKRKRNDEDTAHIQDLDECHDPINKLPFEQWQSFLDSLRLHYLQTSTHLYLHAPVLPYPPPRPLLNKPDFSSPPSQPSSSQPSTPSPIPISSLVLSQPNYTFLVAYPDIQHVDQDTDVALSHIISRRLLNTHRPSVSSPQRPDTSPHTYDPRASTSVLSLSYSTTFPTPSPSPWTPLNNFNRLGSNPVNEFTSTFSSTAMKTSLAPTPPTHANTSVGKLNETKKKYVQMDSLTAEQRKNLSFWQKFKPNSSHCPRDVTSDARGGNPVGMTDAVSSNGTMESLDDRHNFIEDSTTVSFNFTSNNKNAYNPTLSQATGTTTEDAHQQQVTSVFSSTSSSSLSSPAPYHIIDPCVAALSLPILPSRLYYSPYFSSSLQPRHCICVSNMIADIATSQPDASSLPGSTRTTSTTSNLLSHHQSLATSSVPSASHHPIEQETTLSTLSDLFHSSKRFRCLDACHSDKTWEVRVQRPQRLVDVSPLLPLFYSCLVKDLLNCPPWSLKTAKELGYIQNTHSDTNDEKEVTGIGEHTNYSADVNVDDDNDSTLPDHALTALLASIGTTFPINTATSTGRTLNPNDTTVNTDTSTSMDKAVGIQVPLLFSRWLALWIWPYLSAAEELAGWSANRHISTIPRRRKPVSNMSSQPTTTMNNGHAGSEHSGRTTGDATCNNSMNEIANSDKLLGNTNGSSDTNELIDLPPPNMVANMTREDRSFLGRIPPTLTLSINKIREEGDDNETNQYQRIRSPPSSATTPTSLSPLSFQTLLSATSTGPLAPVTIGLCAERLLTDCCLALKKKTRSDMKNMRRMDRLVRGLGRKRTNTVTGAAFSDSDDDDDDGDDDEELVETRSNNQVTTNNHHHDSETEEMRRNVWYDQRTRDENMGDGNEGDFAYRRIAGKLENTTSRNGTHSSSPLCRDNINDKSSGGGNALGEVSDSDNSIYSFGGGGSCPHFQVLDTDRQKGVIQLGFMNMFGQMRLSM